MQPQQQIRAYFPADIGAMLRGLSAARPDLNEAWTILAQQVGFENPAAELGIRVRITLDQPSPPATREAPSAAQIAASG